MKQSKCLIVWDRRVGEGRGGTGGYEREFALAREGRRGRHGRGGAARKGGEE